ncbi:alpha/beta fold hydrolase [Baaleninema sp.]|uniref:alpha/beta fold hydrolase n=1 Tax=Baaleninema sp. TaxID=3101197 RepID=UPI003D089FD3
MSQTIANRFVRVFNKNIHLQEAGTPEKPVILFLHGASFSSQTWRELGSLLFFAERGYRSIAVDLPGYGLSQRLFGRRDNFLEQFLEAANISHPVLVSPSMSGNYSLPFLVEHPDKLRGYIPVAPVGISQFRKRLEGIEVPTLAIWGDDDRILSVSQAEIFLDRMANAQKVVLKKAGHACYMKATEAFHQAIWQFLEELPESGDRT